MKRAAESLRRPAPALGAQAFVFRADSLRRFKAKYADSWQPRYAVYQSRLYLPRLALALHRICEIRPEHSRLSRLLRQLAR